MARFSLQLVLCLVILSAVILYLIQYLNETKTVGYSTRCKDLQNVCQSQEKAISCGVFEDCLVKQKDYGLVKNGTLGTNTTSKVFVKVYYESFCPDSEDFILQQLFPTYEKLYDSGIFNLSLIPSGNVEETKKSDQWVFKCQHGKQECLGNLIEICAISELGSIVKWMPYIYCLQKRKATPENAVICAKEQGFDYGQIKSCIDGPLGNKLQHEMVLKTAALKPPHTFIPWITINDESKGLQKKALNNLLELICSKYTGKGPKACEQ